MKKTLLLFALLAGGLSAFNANKASAQITGLNNLYFQDSSFYYCIAQENVQFTLEGGATGTASATDSVNVYINYGDGSDTSFKMPFMGGTQPYYYTTTYHNYGIAGSFTPTATVTFGSFSTTAAGSPVVLSNSCAPVSGNVYIDNNANCAYDAGTDAHLAYSYVRIVNNTLADTTWGWVDYYGHFDFNLPTGYAYTLTPQYDWYWYNYNNTIAPSCGSTGNWSFTLNAGDADSMNFAYTCTPLSTDSSVDLSAWGWGHHFRPSDSGDIYLSAGVPYWNYNCNSLDATVTLVLDPHLSYAYTEWGVPPTTVAGNTLTWAAGTFNSVNFYYSLGGIRVYCDAGANLGDTLCNLLTIIPGSMYPDPNMSNNVYNICAVVSNSFDPNEKQVAPKGEGPQGFIQPNSTLNYFIEFQNTGTDVAYNVTVVDTINSNIDISSMKVLASSAHADVYTEGNVVKFRFNNINLPAESVSELGSRGYISYSVHLKNNLPFGTQITNTAHIYFDANADVATNTTLNTLPIPTSVQQLQNGTLKVTVAPNPANEQVVVKTDNKSEFTATMIDMTGRTVATRTSNGGSAAISTGILPSGLYIVKVAGAKGSEVTTKITVQH